MSVRSTFIRGITLLALFFANASVMQAQIGNTGSPGRMVLYGPLTAYDGSLEVDSATTFSQPVTFSQALTMSSGATMGAALNMGDYDILGANEITGTTSLLMEDSTGNSFVSLTSLAVSIRPGVSGVAIRDSDSNIAILVPSTPLAPVQVSPGLNLNFGSLSGIGRFGGSCPSLASADVMAPIARCHSVTGSTAITELTTGSFVAGDELTLIFAGSITLTDGKDIRLNDTLSDFVAEAGDVWKGIFNGSDFLELSRSEN